MGTRFPFTNIHQEMLHVEIPTLYRDVFHM